MNAFETLVAENPQARAAKGTEHTVREIAQQPECWEKAAQLLAGRKTEICAFLEQAGLRGNAQATLILTGAGSSEFVGNAIAPALRKNLKRQVLSLSTTDIVTHPERVFAPGTAPVVLSFARSGNSPESLATYRLVRQLSPKTKQIAITCNPDGALAKEAKADPNGLYIALPEETNDKSLVMTSSFSTMALAAAALGLVDHPENLSALSAPVAAAGRRILSEYGDTIYKFAARPFNRACYLGSGALNGTMQECHLKLQEMTEGRVVCTFNSFVGLRHGPQVFVNSECLVVAALSTDPYVRGYELDMLRELKAKKQGAGTLAIVDRTIPDLKELADEVIELAPLGPFIADEYRVMTDVMVGQILGTFKCMSLGLRPDNPSVSGTINRVVQGVNIYPFKRN